MSSQGAGLTWQKDRINDEHRTNPGSIRDALSEPDIPFNDPQERQKYRGNGQDRSPFEPPGAYEKRFELIPFNKIMLEIEPAYLVKGLIPRAGLTIIWGPPKCGKSFGRSILRCISSSAGNIAGGG
jgi:hypothetical protein